MDERTRYKTRQRDLLQEYLETVPGVHITVQDVCSHFHEIGVPIGQTTVYRQLERMVDEGLVNKYIVDSHSPACFEYLPGHREKKTQPCFHCKCEKCGQLIHLHCDEMIGFQKHLLEQHAFTLDPKRTVFYGLCEGCRKAEELLGKE